MRADADLAACRTQLANGSRSFLAASLLLPRAVRDPACALYAFCREADDAIDTAERSEHALAMLRARLDGLYAGRPGPRAADRALATVVRDHALPRALPEALLEGFAWDAEGRRYETLDELLDYAARVAATVGAMMAVLMGARSAAALARACDLGVAMQLSNIARDVGEDARLGRLYLPRAWLREAGIDPEAWLAAPRFDAALAGVVERLLAVADALYERVGAGVAELPLACRPGINAARYLYAQIGQEVRRHGCDSLSRRAVVAPWRKAAWMCAALAVLAPAHAAQAMPPLEATRFLVAAAALPPTGEPQGVFARYVRLIEMFDRLEREDRGALAAQHY